MVDWPSPWGPPRDRRDACSAGQVLVDLATKSLEPRQRDLMTQLLVDWANKYAARPDVGGPFHLVRPAAPPPWTPAPDPGPRLP